MESSNKKPKVVVMGGGTGTYTVLRGLKKYPLELKAVVAMTDDGGSSGILRDELGVLPPGDIRQCLVALSESSEAMRKIFNYRFSEGRFQGHSLGNLLISALEKEEGSLDKALGHLQEILALKGEVVPVTLDKVKLIAELEDGEIVFGEDNINRNQNLKRHTLRRIFLQPQAQVNPKASEVIREADFVVIGPGNLYASLIPLFLVEGVREAFERSRAKVIYNANLMTKFGHTDNFSVFDFVETLERFLGQRRLDFILFNNKRPDPHLVEKYTHEGEPVAIPDEESFVRGGRHFIGRHLITNEVRPQVQGDLLPRTLIRHDPHKLAGTIFELIQRQGSDKVLP